jgi:TonB family protein
LVEAQIKKFAPVASLGDAPLLPAPPLELPTTSRLDDADFDALLLPATNEAARLRERLGKMNNLAFGELQGRRRSRPAVSARSVSSPVAALLSPAARQQLLSLDRPEKKALAEDLGLSGPIARERRVLFRPPLPRVALAREVVVRMRFWVRPDGSVNRIETNRIGDLELVNAAQKYLQQWRFSTLPPEVPQTEQWGQLTVIFRVSQ